MEDFLAAGRLRQPVRVCVCGPLRPAGPSFNCAACFREDLCIRPPSSVRAAGNFVTTSWASPPRWTGGLRAQSPSPRPQHLWCVHRSLGTHLHVAKRLAHLVPCLAISTPGLLPSHRRSLSPVHRNWRLHPIRSPLMTCFSLLWEEETIGCFGLFLLSDILACARIPLKG